MRRLLAATIVMAAVLASPTWAGFANAQELTPSQAVNEARKDYQESLITLYELKTVLDSPPEVQALVQKGIHDLHNIVRDFGAGSTQALAMAELIAGYRFEGRNARELTR